MSFRSTSQRSILSTNDSNCAIDFTVSFTDSDQSSFEQFLDRYEIHKKVGRGSQAIVSSALDKRLQVPVALKIFQKKMMSFSDLIAAYQEYSILSEFNHPNVVKTLGYFEDNDYIIIINELMTQDVRSIIRGFGASIDENNIQEIFYQMLRTIDHCHHLDIVHRDVKLENFLIDIDCQDKLVVKLNDFGIACRYSADRPPT